MLSRPCTERGSSPRRSSPSAAWAGARSCDARASASARDSVVAIIDDRRERDESVGPPSEMRSSARTIASAEARLAKPGLLHERRGLRLLRRAQLPQRDRRRVCPKVIGAGPQRELASFEATWREARLRLRCGRLRCVSRRVGERICVSQKPPRRELTDAEKGDRCGYKGNQICRPRAAGDQAAAETDVPLRRLNLDEGGMLGATMPPNNVIHVGEGFLERPRVSGEDRRILDVKTPTPRSAVVSAAGTSMLDAWARRNYADLDRRRDERGVTRSRRCSTFIRSTRSSCALHGAAARWRSSTGPARHKRLASSSSGRRKKTDDAALPCAFFADDLDFLGAARGRLHPQEQNLHFSLGARVPRGVEDAARRRHARLAKLPATALVVEKEMLAFHPHSLSKVLERRAGAVSTFAAGRPSSSIVFSPSSLCAAHTSVLLRDAGGASIADRVSDAVGGLEGNSPRTSASTAPRAIKPPPPAPSSSSFWGTSRWRAPAHALRDDARMHLVTRGRAVVF